MDSFVEQVILVISFVEQVILELLAWKLRPWVRVGPAELSAMDQALLYDFAVRYANFVIQLFYLILQVGFNEALNLAGYSYNSILSREQVANLTWSMQRMNCQVG